MNTIKASQYGQPVPEDVGYWTFGTSPDSFTGELCGTPEEAIRDAKSYYAEDGEHPATIWIAEIEEASVPVPDVNHIADYIEDAIYDKFRDEEFCLFDSKEMEFREEANQKFNADICAAVARYLTATNAWPKYYAYAKIKQVELT